MVKTSKSGFFMSKTNAELLDEVESAISRILTGGQDVSLSDKRLINARLDTLYKMRDDLLRKIALSSASCPARNTGIIRR